MVSQSMRNVGVFAHVDAGKTTTTEHMLFKSGTIRSLGSVDDGTAQTDNLDIERQRGISVRAATTSIIWRDIYINLVDTPGHVDFLSEVERSIRVMDGAILIVSAAEGVQSQTETIWHALRSLSIPTIIYVNKMDRVGVSVPDVLEQIRRLLSPSTVPLQVPQGAGEDFTGILPIWNTLQDDQNSELDLSTVITSVADHDDELMLRYIEGEHIPIEELQNRFQSLTKSGHLFPLCFGSSQRDIGVAELMDAITTYLPSPMGDVEAPLSGIIFKIERDKAMGRTAYVRLFNGYLRNRDLIHNVTRDIHEKITQIRKLEGRKFVDLGQVFSGDIAAVYGLSQSKIGDVLGSTVGVPSSPEIAIPLLTVQVHVQDEHRYSDLVEALQELTDEDPQLDLQWLQDERELHLKVMGAIQLEILSSLLMSRFALEVTFDQPSVIYKETPTKSAEGFIAYTMPKPCWAVLRFQIDPLPRGSGLVYQSEVRSDDLLIRYQNEVARRVPEALLQGLHGWEVTDLKVTLTEGEHHVWHTHPLDFVVATPMGIMDGLANSETTLLEPLLKFRITTPEEYGGKVLSDLVQMRAEFEPPSIIHGRIMVEGILPVATSLEYPIKLRSMTGGRGVMSSSYAGYQACPPDVHVDRPRRGVDPLDQSKYILSVRNALS
ncbi:elongation factor G [Paenibacillus macquariensis]|uniref:Ribosomal protection tetracycline resistance protein n=1 Tax=Paenibacillus macquariensis TaxID=948756 RepID=A0ABY1K073_9BACL|nr:TetM/TetW/TetO/TetS family tetracycline resistance ribosomal protection protein [Paenibacillus macquariensis]MEC0091469.1 TetM/TetW/TetO/TetS family tetracycline resistance ribosomal protection protein [Paenibacillus macquariensis]OAB38145.1 GTP-binding protein [Paenibacillus macquariensis subsp. macquariensis]SIR07405.1 ribosomal protection tetracycline resistance protein [Paenibacillus macquariensis]